MKRTADLAYIAGFFDGEGCAYTAAVNSKHPHLVVKIAQNEREVLDWIVAIFGFGKVYAKTDARTVNVNHYVQFAHRQARIVLTYLEPYLKVKKDSVTAMLDQYGRQRA